ncbi:MAG TPA: hypothetical protein VMR50_17745 [Myxococcota bacterium]|nr:hypothetical protein [Myxococcota bacterium]
MRFFLRALVWLAASAGLLLAGFFALAVVLLVPSFVSRGGVPGDVQRDSLGLVYSAIAMQALLPELCAVFVTWLALARVAPGLERSGRSLALGLPLVAAAWFPAVGHYLFTVWSPTGPGTYAMTLFLVGGGAALALLVPRASSPHLAPGCFAPEPDRDMVNRDE